MNNDTTTDISTTTKEADCFCGPFSIAKITNNQCRCTCQDHHVGTPPNCQPECLANSDCPAHQSCQNRRCIDPCQDTCGGNADCKVFNHRALCACKEGHIGDPYYKCTREPPNFDNDDNDDDYDDDDTDEEDRNDACRRLSTFCGQFASCKTDRRGKALCECLPGHIGQPPLCHPECKSNYDCPGNQACINDKCEDSCQGACGVNAQCQVVDHNPRCFCPPSYSGDPYDTCQPLKDIFKPPTTTTIINATNKTKDDQPKNPCSTCGPNSKCQIDDDGNNERCVCLDNYIGDPLTGCRPECLLNTDCPKTKACVSGKCLDPCPNTCGVNAICTVTNHFTICSCEVGFSGDAFKSCSPTVPCND